MKFSFRKTCASSDSLKKIPHCTWKLWHSELWRGLNIYWRSYVWLFSRKKMADCLTVKRCKFFWSVPYSSDPGYPCLQEQSSIVACTIHIVFRVQKLSGEFSFSVFPKLFWKIKCAYVNEIFLSSKLNSLSNWCKLNHQKNSSIHETFFRSSKFLSYPIIWIFICFSGCIFQHFRTLAEENKLENDSIDDRDTDRLLL